MSKSNEKAQKATTDVVHGTVTLEQVGFIDALIGKFGSNRQDVVGKILSSWLYENVVKNVEVIKNGNKRETN